MVVYFALHDPMRIVPPHCLHLKTCYAINSQNQTAFVINPCFYSLLSFYRLWADC